LIELPDVTLFVLTSVDYDAHIASLERSMRGINFGEVLFISHDEPKNLPEKVRWSQGPEMKNMKEWNHACIYELHKHIKTSHCLFVHDDSWVLNPESWDDDWLEYDYIGAPWVLRGDETYSDPWGKRHRVGNGGFSLRSKKLLEVPINHEVVFEVNVGDFYKHMNANIYNEDGNICVHNRHIYEKAGCKFAPVSVAAKFSHENQCVETEGVKPFGFHKHIQHAVKWGVV
jgi:hypothetical protein